MRIMEVGRSAASRHPRVRSAINVPADDFRRNLSTPAKLAEELGRAGVDVDYEAVIVSNGGLNPDSALAYLMLERVGQHEASVFALSVDDLAFAGLAVV